jgi:hypothetical protein
MRINDDPGVEETNAFCARAMRSPQHGQPAHPVSLINCGFWSNIDQDAQLINGQAAADGAVGTSSPRDP